MSQKQRTKDSDFEMVREEHVRFSFIFFPLPSENCSCRERASGKLDMKCRKNDGNKYA